MGKNHRKRSRAQFEAAAESQSMTTSTIGVGATLAHLKSPELPPDDAAGPGPLDEHGFGKRIPEENEWATVSKGSRNRQNKRRRKEANAESKSCEAQAGKSNYPRLAFAELHKLHGMTKLGDLQSLLLYCLTDGTAPQWVSVSHHLAVRKAVVLFVPGLEKGMFNGSVALDEHELQLSGDVASLPKAEPNATSQTNSPDCEQEGKIPESHIAAHTVEHADSRLLSTIMSPDNYLPISLNVEKLPSSLRSLADMFVHLWPVKAPGDEKYSKVFSPLHAMLTAPIPKSQDEKEKERNVKGPKPPSAGKHWEDKPTPVIAFLNSLDELRDNDYVIHPAQLDEEQKEQEASRRTAEKQSVGDGWIDSAIENLQAGDVTNGPLRKGILTAGHSVLAVDCEMCTVEGGEAALTRISIVDWDGKVVMDELVKPSKPIIDYLTPYSGITAAKLASITTSLNDIQTRLLTLLTPQTILVGHSLESDLNALKTTHPFIIDTSILYPHPRGPPLKSSLKWLSQKYLGREIQKGHGSTGHDSIEDARVCIDLVRMKCEKGPKWGSQDIDREPIFKRLARARKSGVTTIANGAPPEGKTGAIIDHGNPSKTFGQMATFSIGCTTDTEIVHGIRRAVLGDPDGALIPGPGVDLTWARFRELEALRGWSNENRYPGNQHPPTTTSTTPITEPSPSALSKAVSQLTQHIKTVHDFLPPCSLLIVYSGTGDPRELARLQALQRTFKREYASKKWDELSVKWTDEEEVALKRACRVAREGVGLVCIK